MIPRPFELHSPATVAEAVAMLKRLRDPKVLAGGQSLVPLMKLRLVSPANLVDIGRIRGLRYVRKEGGRLAIGSMTTHHDLAASFLVAARCPALAEAAAKVGDVQVRNRGTIGGTSCHADPSADVPAVLVSLDAEFRVASPSGRRSITAERFFRDIFTTDLRRNEVLTEVRVPVLPRRTGGAYLKLQRAKSDLAIVGVAATVTLDRAGACRDARIGLAGVGPTPIRATEAEEELEGEEPTDAVLARAADKAAEASDPSSDIRGSAEYKRAMVKVFVERAVRQGLSRV